MLGYGARLIPRERPVPPPPAVPWRSAVSPRLIRSALGAATLNGSFWGLLIACGFRLADQLGWTPLAVGAALLPASMPAAALAPFSASLVGRFGPTRLIALGAGLPPLGYVLIWWLADRQVNSMAAYAAWLLPGLLLVGVGFALCFSALHVQALAGVSPAAQGTATALYQTAVQLGGVAVLVIIAIPALAALGVVTAVGVLGFLIALPGVLVRKGTA